MNDVRDSGRCGDRRPPPHALSIGFGADWSGLAAAWLTGWERDGPKAAKAEARLRSTMEAMGYCRFFNATKAEQKERYMLPNVSIASLPRLCRKHGTLTGLALLTSGLRGPLTLNCPAGTVSWIWERSHFSALSSDMFPPSEPKGHPQ
ncbi:hypothetical protein GCM10010252_71120 [Streptomyces aureoverticillatus]|nr:hypothetical protein GCM10010252_71120 [Streptomyces aureoverticillatus]